MELKLATKEQSLSYILNLAKNTNKAVLDCVRISTNKNYAISHEEELWFNIMRSSNPEGNRNFKKRLLEDDYLYSFNLDHEPAFKKRKVEKLLNIKEQSYPELIAYFQKIDRSHSKFEHKDGTEILMLERIEREAKNALLFGTGNCHEMTSLAFVFLLEYLDPKIVPPNQLYPDIFIHWLWLEEPGDHAYLSISDKFDNTVIVDPWTNEVLALSDENCRADSKWHKQVQNYKSMNRFTARLSVGHSIRWIQRRIANKEPFELSSWLPAHAPKS